MKARSACTMAVVVAGALSVTSCSGASGGSNSGEYALDGTFVTVIKEDPGNLNPLVTNKVAARSSAHTLTTRWWTSKQLPAR